ncbi:MAG TPA: DUF3854 domain-containing protein, partial [Thermodesulfobacteriota bacterium]|nr:DUF3854 domain-containing protein [Thermodesulfobacteriota bacterium]
MMIDNDQMQKGHDCQLGFDGWIIADIKKSGLAPDNFTADPLRDEEELKRRLGFTQISNIPIMSVGGYWIPYPNVSEYFRLKLREEIKTEDGNIRYLSPQKELGKGNHAYILQDVGQLLKSYNPDKPIFITEGEKKSVKASIEGFPCIGLSGVWNFKDSENDFLPELGNFVWTDRDVFIVFDSDITEKHNVRHAEIRLAVELTNRGARVFSIRLPNESDGDKNGLDDYLERYGKEKFQELINSVKPTLELHVEEDTINRLMLTELHNLRNGIEREKILKLLTKREGVSFETVKSEFYKNRPEKEKSGTEEKVSTPEETKKVEEELYTPEEIEKAKALLKSQDILGEMMKHTECSGHVGEEINKEMLYLSFTSRKMDKAISCIIKGASASGKNALTDCILQLMPKEDVLKYSLLTSKALAHFSGNLSHKILYVAEHAGSESANYSVRTVISEGEISIALPVKDETTNDFETMEKRIEAKGLCFIETTTTERIHPENQTRLFDLFIDESSAQTALILNSHTQIVDIEKVEKERRVWQALQSLLEPYNVIVPFTKALISVFPTDKIRVRRDFP